MQRIFIFGFSISHLYLAYILAALTFVTGLPMERQIHRENWRRILIPMLSTGKESWAILTPTHTTLWWLSI